MIQFNNQTFLQILRSNSLDVDEFVRKELNVIAEILEEYHVESACDLQKELHKSKSQKKSNSKNVDVDVFVNECKNCVLRREGGENVVEQIASLVEEFGKLSRDKIKKFANTFDLPLSKKDETDISKFRTWLQTGQKPLTKEQEKQLNLENYAEKWRVIYNVSNKTVDGKLSSEDIQQLVVLAQEILVGYKVKVLKEFLAKVGVENIKGAEKTIINNLQARLEGNDSASKRRSGRSNKSNIKEDKLEQLESYKQQVQSLRETLNANPANEIRNDTVQRIVGIISDVNKKCTKDNFISFVNDCFDIQLKKSENKTTLLEQAIEHVNNSFLHLPIIRQKEKQYIEKSEQSANNEQDETLKQIKSSAQIEDYVREARRLRSEELLADGTIPKIINLANAVKSKYKVEGLKKFMEGLGISYFGIKTGDLIYKVQRHLEEVALMQFKGIDIQEMD